VPATVEAFSGKFIARGGDLTLLEGEWPQPAACDYRVSFARCRRRVV